MNLDTITTDAAGRTHTTYSDGADYYLGQPWAQVSEISDGFTTMLGWYERNGWNGSRESVVAPSSNDRPVKTVAAALRRAEQWIAKNTRKAA